MSKHYPGSIRGPQPKFERNDHIVNVYRSGKSMSEISTTFNLSRERVRQIIDRDERIKGESKQRNCYEGPTETRHCILKNCNNTFNVRPSSNRKYCSKKCSRQFMSQLMTKVLPIEEIVKDYREGMSIANLVEKYDTPISTIYRRLRGMITLRLSRV